MAHVDDHILIVEDSNFNAQVLAHAVSGLAPVTIVETGAEALSAMAAHNFSVVLLDIMLPDIDGFEICRKIISDKGTDAPAILFVTSLEHSDNEEKGLKLGAVDYIEKPIVASIVKARVNNHLNLARARKDLLAVNAELSRLATTDFLTGTNNRRHFFECMDSELARAKRYGHDYALLAIDLDHFKAVNDTFGHDRGDAVLTAVSDAWQKALRAHDILGRVGGEEFSVFLPHVDTGQAMATAERLLAATDRKSTRLNSSHSQQTRMPSSA